MVKPQYLLTFGRHCLAMSKKQKVLVLGGTQFIGRNLVGHLMARTEFEVSLFNRQKTGAQLFSQLQKIKGDRETKDIDQIAKTDWDFIVDCSCYYPEALQAVLRNVKRHSLKKYIFISSCSAYDNSNEHTPYKNETALTLECTSEQATDRTPSSYGQRKAECERILMSSGLPYVILRPALVYGPYDPTDRLYYWLHQVKTRHQLLLPDMGMRQFSITYVHDLVSSILSTLSSKKMGIFNIISQEFTSIATIVEEASSSLRKTYDIVNAPADFLKSEKIAQWTDMPLWLNGDHYTYSNKTMKEDLGLTPTSLSASLEVTLNYFEELHWPEPTYGIPEKLRLHLIEKARKWSANS